MLRRSFLLSVSAAAIAAALPTPVFAIPNVHVDSGMPIAKFELIEQALDAGQKLDFSLPDQAELFGFEPNVGMTTQQLRDTLYDHVVGDFENLYTWNRIRYVVAIHEQLKLRSWILPPSLTVRTRPRDSEHTLRELMLHSQAGLRCVARMLGSGIAEHSLAEMRAFG